MSISLLDSQKKASNYPKFLVNGVNNTFSVYVEVENHMEKTINAQILVKATENKSYSVPITSITPLASYNATMETKTTWQEIASISLDNPGNYLIFFELWISDQEMETYQFSNNYSVLNIQVV